MHIIRMIHQTPVFAKKWTYAKQNKYIESVMIFHQNIARVVWLTTPNKSMLFASD